jgi:hypothetical protein
MGWFLFCVFHWISIRVFAVAFSVQQGTMVLYRGRHSIGRQDRA